MKKRINILIVFVAVLFLGIMNAKAYSAEESNAKEQMETSSGAILSEYCYYNQSGRPKDDGTYEVIIAASANNRYAGADVYSYADGKMKVEHWDSNRGCPMAVITQTDFRNIGSWAPGGATKLTIASKKLYAIYSVTDYVSHITSFENDNDKSQYTFLLVKKTNVQTGETTNYYEDNPGLKMTCEYNFDLRGTKRTLVLKFGNDNSLYGVSGSTMLYDYDQNKLNNYFLYMPIHLNFDANAVFLSTELMLNIKYNTLFSEYCPQLTACKWKGRATWVFFENIDKKGTGYDKTDYCDTQFCSNTDDPECNPGFVDENACRSFNLITSDEQKKEYCTKVVKTQNYSSPCTQRCLNYLKDTGELYENDSECGITDELVVWIMNILRWIKYIIPVIIIILSILDFIKALSSEKEDEMKKAQKHFVTRLIVAVLIFIMPIIIEFILGKMGFDASNCGIENIGF